MIWTKGQIEGTWKAGSGRYTQEIVGPALLRTDNGQNVAFYLLRKMRRPNGLGNAKDYVWGYYNPPQFAPNGSRLSNGTWTYSSYATEQNWDHWWQHGVRDERPIDQRPATEPLDAKPQPAPNPDKDYSSSLDAKDINPLLIAAAALVLIGIGYMIWK